MKLQLAVTSRQAIETATAAILKSDDVTEDDDGDDMMNCYIKNVRPQRPAKPGMRKAELSYLNKNLPSTSRATVTETDENGFLFFVSSNGILLPKEERVLTSVGS